MSSLSQLLVWNTLSLHARGLPWAVELFPCPRRSRNGEGGSVPHGPAAREQGTWSGRPPAALSLSLAADVFRRPPPLSPVLRLGLAIVLDSSAYSIQSGSVCSDRQAQTASETQFQDVVVLSE